MLAYDRSQADGEVLRALALLREEIHGSHASSRPLSEGYELVGLVGEYEFACAGRAEGVPLELDTGLRPEGDGGVDFRVGRYTIDVKTARKPGHLLVEAGRPGADLVVLARYRPELAAELVCWEWRRVLLLHPVRTFNAVHPIPSHACPSSAARRLPALWDGLRAALPPEKRWPRTAPPSGRSASSAS